MVMTQRVAGRLKKVNQGILVHTASMDTVAPCPYVYSLYLLKQFLFNTLMV